MHPGPRERTSGSAGDQRLCRKQGSSSAQTGKHSEARGALLEQATLTGHARQPHRSRRQGMRQSHKPQGNMTIVPWPRDSQGLGEAQDHVRTTVRANSRAIQRGRVGVGGRGKEHVLGACSVLRSLLYREDNAISHNSRRRQVLLLLRSSWDARPLQRLCALLGPRPCLSTPSPEDGTRTSTQSTC